MILRQIDDFKLVTMEGNLCLQRELLVDCSVVMNLQELLLKFDLLLQLALRLLSFSISLLKIHLSLHKISLASKFE